MKQIYLFPGEWAYSREEAEISTILGSCVAVAIYDYKLQTGGLNHYLLPSPPSHEAPSARYGTIAIPLLIEEMIRDGSKKNCLQAKVYGGASVLNGVTIGDGIGVSNIDIAIQILEMMNIPVIEKNVGGLHGRKIALNTFTFEVFHRLQEKS